MAAVEEIPEPRTVRTADGSVTGYYEYGDPDGGPSSCCTARRTAARDSRGLTRPLVRAACASSHPTDRASATPIPGDSNHAVTVADYAGPLRAFADALRARLVLRARLFGRRSVCACGRATRWTTT